MEAKADERTNGKSVKIVQKVSKNKGKEFSYKMTVIRQRQEHATQTYKEDKERAQPLDLLSLRK